MSEKKYQPKIIVFACTWCGYPAATLAGVHKTKYPSNVRIVRVMCTGSVEPGIIMDAFESGTDGVMVVGCQLDNCHYLTGNKKAQERIDALKRLFDIVGLDSRRLRTEWLNASEGAKFVRSVNEFVEDVRALGPLEIERKKAKKARSKDQTLAAVKQLIEDTGAFDCVECGKCTTVCPVAKWDPEFAPRTIVLRSMEGIVDNIARDKDIWMCTTCEQCNAMCPYKVDYSGFIRGMREEASDLGAAPSCSQGGLIHATQRIMAKSGLKQKRLDWVKGDMKVAEKGDVFYFVGCLPHYDAIFYDRQDMKLLDIAESAVRIMNKAGVVPVVSNEEKCCGHDLNWIGDEDDFEKLMDRNLDLIRKSGAKTVVFTCPECYRTFNTDYQDLAGDLEFKFVHISDYVKELVDSGALKMEAGKKPGFTFSYHDSCRLGRHSGVYDSPRELAKAFSGAKFVEMENTKDKAICCAVSAWSNCNANAKRIQIERVMEAKKVGADRLLMFCPKCQIHFKCAVQDKVPVDPAMVNVKLEDFTVALAKLLELMPEEEKAKGNP
ncbi:MAG: hydrogenase iron-sulfur subunit [Thermoplasmata archaeon]|jgi:Fe-S oxidoreductase/coenzyme F420-reducing hydrogenase delta subunit|nr:hydrogenase iron-sulfur subunit [Thermoplasmata archaeon]